MKQCWCCKYSEFDLPHPGITGKCKNKNKHILNFHTCSDFTAATRKELEKKCGWGEQ